MVRHHSNRDLIKTFYKHKDVRLNLQHPYKKPRSWWGRGGTGGQEFQLRLHRETGESRDFVTRGRDAYVSALISRAITALETGPTLGSDVD